MHLYGTNYLIRPLLATHQYERVALWLFQHEILLRAGY